MLMGIDVGGTFTDGVIFAKGEIIATTKVRTDNEDIKAGVLQILDQLMAGRSPGEISRVVLSTTVVTNLLATGRGERTALLLIPGYGLPAAAYDIGEDTFFLAGGVDFRGRIIDELDEAQLKEVCARIDAAGIKRVAVAAKFSNRNDRLEQETCAYIKEMLPAAEVFMGAQIAGKLNFPRRAATAYYTAVTSKEWNSFVDDIEQAWRERSLQSEVHILKADGGTMPLSVSRTQPCETVFSGPAASTMGALAISGGKTNAVVLDIGGTTTDIALIIDGLPLYASKGASINRRYTHVNAFAVRSIALGGDSIIRAETGIIEVEAYRQDIAACFGGHEATVTDAFNSHLNLNIGDSRRSREVLDKLALVAGKSREDVCEAVIAIVMRRLTASVEDMFKEWENEPAYRVWEIVNQRQFTPDIIVGIGAAASAIIPELSRQMGIKYLIHHYSDVANALGAAIARPTLTVNLHADTNTRQYSLDPGGVKGNLEKPNKFQLEDARALARNYLEQLGLQQGMGDYVQESSFFMEEQFNMIRGWDSTGKLFDVGIQVTPGFVKEFKGVKA